MSRASKITLATTAMGAVGITAFVHWSQRSEQAAMHAGVIRDLERQEQRRREREERELDFALQKRLEEQYRGAQDVSGDEPSRMASQGTSTSDTTSSRSQGSSWGSIGKSVKSLFGG